MATTFYWATGGFWSVILFTIVGVELSTVLTIGITVYALVEV